MGIAVNAWAVTYELWIAASAAAGAGLVVFIANSLTGTARTEKPRPEEAEAVQGPRS